MTCTKKWKTATRRPNWPSTCWSAASKTLGAYFFLLGGKVDALVFTAGIGENDDIVRAKVCEGLEELGVRLNLEENGTRKPGARTISTPDSKIKVLIIPTNEELQIAQATMEVLA